jgi:hypothetical protein
MFKKTAFVISAIILLLIAAIFLFAKDIEISVSEIEAQSAIDDYLVSDNYHHFGVNISPKSISIDFKADDSAHIKSEMTIDGHGYSGQFDGKFSTSITYRIPRLYLDEIELIEGGFLTDNETKSELSELKNAARNVLRRKRKSLEEKNSTDARIILTDEKVLEGLLLSGTKKFFETIPIYNLKRSGKTGIISRLALKDVRFTDEAALISLSPVTALLRILAALGLFCLFVAYFLGPLILQIFLARSTTNNAE